MHSIQNNFQGVHYLEVPLCDKKLKIAKKLYSWTYSSPIAVTLSNYIDTVELSKVDKLGPNKISVFILR